MIGTVRFDLRKDKVLKSGKCPLHMIYSLRGKRKVYNTGLQCLEQNWDLENQRFNTISKKSAVNKEHTYAVLDKVEVTEYNDKLQDLMAKVSAIEKRYELEGISSELVVDKLKELSSPNIIKTEPNGLVYDFIERYIRENQNSRAEGSLKVYTTLKRHLSNFEKAKRVKVKFEDIDYHFFEVFHNYLLECDSLLDEDRKLMNSTIAKQLSTLKTFLSYANKHGVTINQSYRNFKIIRQEKEVIALTRDEFERICNLDLSNNNRLEKVRDLFCFSIATGLRWSDIQSLSHSNIKPNAIRITVVKTKENISIPLNRYSSAILKKYEGDVYPLPRLTNQKFNDYVKELCKVADIDEEIEIVSYRGAERIATTVKKYELMSAHVGRRTFVTLSLELGMNIPQIMKITGHKSYKSFKRYVEISERNKEDAMQNAWGKPMEVLKMKVV